MRFEERNTHTISGLKKKISELTETIASLTKQLDQYRSVRGQLSTGALKQENEELRKSNSQYKAIVEQHGLGHLLGRNRKTVHKNHEAR